VSGPHSASSFETLGAQKRASSLLHDPSVMVLAVKKAPLGLEVLT